MSLDINTSKDNALATDCGNAKPSSTTPGTLMPPLIDLEPLSVGELPSNEGRVCYKIDSPPMEQAQQQSWSSEITQASKPTRSSPRTAFMMFTRNRSNGSSNFKDVDFDVLAEEYRKLPKVEKEQWEAEARKDKIRYCAEKNNHNGSWHVPKRRARKHPLAPRRPMSAFLRFSKNCRKKVRVDNPHVDNTDIS
eukprot:scaffold2736_cov264-Chaetoceros_neogracile.AAC.1